MSFSPSAFNKVTHYFKYVTENMETYSKLFKWPSSTDLKMIDIGTGPGHLLMAIEAMLPRNYHEIIAVDKSIEMVNYFNSTPKDSRISSRLLNIETKKLPYDVRECFDLAFSCNCFTYITNFRKACENTRSILKPNGELFFLWCKNCYIYDMYRALYQTEKWAPYTSDIKNWKYEFDYDDPIGTLETEFNRADFGILKKEVLDITFENNSEQYFVDIFLCVNEIADRIPKYDLPKFEEDLSRLAHSYIHVDAEAEEEKWAKLPFPTIVVGARKS